MSLNRHLMKKKKVLLALSDLSKFERIGTI